MIPPALTPAKVDVVDARGAQANFARASRIIDNLKGVVGQQAFEIAQANVTIADLGAVIEATTKKLSEAEAKLAVAEEELKLHRKPAA